MGKYFKEHKTLIEKREEEITPYLYDSGSYKDFLDTRKTEIVENLPATDKLERYQRATESPGNVSELEKVDMTQNRSQYNVEDYRNLRTDIVPTRQTEVPGFSEAKLGGIYSFLGQDDVIADKFGLEAVKRYNESLGWDRVNPFSDINREIEALKKSGAIQDVETILGMRPDDSKFAAFLYGAHEKMAGIPPKLVSPYGEKQQESLKVLPEYKVGQLAGHMAELFIYYQGTGRAAAELGVTSKIATSKVGTMLGKARLPNVLAGTKYGVPLEKWLGKQGLKTLASVQGTALLIDAIVLTPGEVMDAIKNDKTMGRFTKNWLIERSLDAGFNLLFDIPRLTREFKAIAKSDSNVAKAIKNRMPNEIAKTSKNMASEIDTLAKGAYGARLSDEYKAMNNIFNGMDKKIPETLEYQSKMARHVENETLQNFELWRKTNFGDNIGRAGGGDLADEEFNMLKQWYKNNKRIDLEAVMKSSKKTQDFLNDIVDLFDVVKAKETIRVYPKTTSLTPEQSNFVFRNVSINPTDVNNLTMAMKELELLENETKVLLGMDLQLFSKNRLKKHQRLLEELKRKGITKMSTTEVESLIEASSEIKGMRKANNKAVKEALASQKKRYKYKEIQKQHDQRHYLKREKTKKNAGKYA